MGIVATIHGRAGYIASGPELDDLVNLLDIAGTLTPLDIPCPGYDDVAQIYEEWSPLVEQLGLLASDADVIFRGYDMSRGWFIFVGSEPAGDSTYVRYWDAQRADPEVSRYIGLGEEASAFLPPTFPEALTILQRNVPKLARGLCPGRASVWPLIAGAAGLAAVGLTAWGVYKYGIKRKGK